MHIASGLRGASDRIGRLVPPLLIGLPFLAIAIPISISLYGRWALLPAMVGACAALFLSGLGLSSIASVVAPYAVSRPGESPFQQPQRTTAAGGIAQGVVLVGAIVVSAPVLWWSFVAIGGDPEFAMAALWGGLLIGVFVLVAGVLVGSAVYERSTGRLMEFAEST
jgi:ABC-2 type transport system permease protein